MVRSPLDAELTAGAWMVYDADPLDIISTSPQTLWRDVVRRQNGRVAWIATAPDDLSLS